MLKILKKVLRVPYTRIFINDLNTKKVELKDLLKTVKFHNNVKEIHFCHKTLICEIYTFDYKQIKGVTNDWFKQYNRT